MSDLDFTSLLCSRLCHDLVSPVGALMNGFELLGDEQDEDMREQVLKMLVDSAAQTSNRLQFFRMAFGAGGGMGAQIALDDAKNAAASFFQGTQVNFSWDANLSHMDKDVVKLLLNLTLVAGESIIRQGDLIVAVVQDGSVARLVITAKADRLILADNARDAMMGRLAQSDVESKSAPAQLAGLLTTELGGEIHIDQSGEGSLIISTVVPSSMGQVVT